MSEESARDMVLVDGAGGYVGSALSEELHRAGYRVRATDLPSVDLSGLAGQGIETMPSDLLDAGSLDKVLAGVEAVVHCAAAFDLSLPLDTLMKVNAGGTRNLVEVCLKKDITRVVHMSTGGVYGIPRTCPVYEDHGIKPLEPYSVSKARAEEVVREFEAKGIKATVLRPTAIHGPGGRYTAGMLFPGLCILKERDIKVPRLRGGPPFNMVHVADVTGAIRFALDNDHTAGRVYNLAETETLTAGEFLDLLASEFALRTGRTFKVRTGLMALMARFQNLMPEAITSRPVERFLQKEWDKVVEKYDLVPALKPSVIHDLREFLIGPHAYSNQKLRNDGYQFKYPSLLESFPGSIKWYREQKWIPDYSNESLPES